eukprot:345263-Rhodomonas_salina.1
MEPSPTAAVTLGPIRLNLMSPRWSVPVCTGREQPLPSVDRDVGLLGQLCPCVPQCTTDACPLCHAINEPSVSACHTPVRGDPLGRAPSRTCRASRS